MALLFSFGIAVQLQQKDEETIKLFIRKLDYYDDPELL